MDSQVKDDLSDFDHTEFTALGETKVVYRKGTGPGVVIMTEIPGITPEVAGFARKVVDLGCTVAMPDLFGEAGKPMTNAYAASSLVRACVSKEFHALAVGRCSPVTDWLRVLARSLHDELGGPGVGAVGMCLTGGFALALMLEDCMIAPVLSQPSLPLPISKSRKRDLGISDDELKVVKERVDAGVCVLGMRFSEDPASPPERFERLRDELGDGFVGIEIDSSKGNPYGNEKMAHSVLTSDLVDEEGHPTRDALDQVMEFFRERLLA
jgi:dienelactone hydrolase